MPHAPPGQCTQGWVLGIPVARLCSTLCFPGPLHPHSREAQSQWVHSHHFPCTSVSPWHQFPTVPQSCRWAQRGVMAVTSWILHHTIPFLPPCWAPLGAEHLDKGISSQGWPKLGQPAQESAAFIPLPWECMWEMCMWEIPGEQGSHPGLFVSNSLQALLLAKTSGVQRVKQVNTMLLQGKNQMTSICKFPHMGSNPPHRSRVAVVLWCLTLSWYFNVSSPILDPPSLEECSATLIHQRLVLQDKLSTCSSKIQVILSSKEHLPTETKHSTLRQLQKWTHMEDTQVLSTWATYC